MTCMDILFRCCFTPLRGCVPPCGYTFQRLSDESFKAQSGGWDYDKGTGALSQDVSGPDRSRRH